jgi:uncharacterized protein
MVLLVAIAAVSALTVASAMTAPAIAADSNDAASKRFCLLGTEVQDIHSKTNGVDYRVYVSLPRDYDKQKSSYPIVYLLDADYTFSLVQNIAWFLADENELEPMILVGIAYPGVAQEKHGPLFKMNRTRDYTPTRIATGGYGAEFQKHSGGADKFLDFIRDELIPQMETKYRVAPHDRTLVGMSFGGLLASYALCTRSNTFQRLLIISPSLWYDKRSVQLPNTRDLPAKVFFCVGGEETKAKGANDMVSDLQSFVGKLKAKKFPSFECRLWVAPDESHHSVPPAAVMRGMRWLFGGIKQRS